jgi:hypothetical protein
MKNRFEKLANIYQQKAMIQATNKQHQNMKKRCLSTHNDSINSNLISNMKHDSQTFQKVLIRVEKLFCKKKKIEA